MPFLTYDMLTEMETKCPNSKIETQKIADCFSYLDNLITLHQRKLELSFFHLGTHVDLVSGDERTSFYRQHHPDIKGGNYDF